MLKQCLLSCTVLHRYNKQRKHPKHKTSENCAKVESSFFTFGLFLLVVTMVLLVNIGFVWALVIDGLSDSDVEIGAADGEVCGGWRILRGSWSDIVIFCADPIL